MVIRLRFVLLCSFAIQGNALNQDLDLDYAWHQDSVMDGVAYTRTVHDDPLNETTTCAKDSTTFWRLLLPTGAHEFNAIGGTTFYGGMLPKYKHQMDGKGLKSSIKMTMCMDGVRSHCVKNMYWPGMKLYSKNFDGHLLRHMKADVLADCLAYRPQFMQDERVDPGQWRLFSAKLQEYLRDLRPNDDPHAPGKKPINHENALKEVSEVLEKHILVDDKQGYRSQLKKTVDQCFNLRGQRYVVLPLAMEMELKSKNMRKSIANMNELWPYLGDMDMNELYWEADNVWSYGTLEAFKNRLDDGSSEIPGLSDAQITTWKNVLTGLMNHVKVVSERPNYWYKWGSSTVCWDDHDCMGVLNAVEGDRESRKFAESELRYIEKTGSEFAAFFVKANPNSVNSAHVGFRNDVNASGADGLKVKILRGHRTERGWSGKYFGHWQYHNHSYTVTWTPPSQVDDGTGRTVMVLDDTGINDLITQFDIVTDGRMIPAGMGDFFDELHDFLEKYPLYYEDKSVHGHRPFAEHSRAKYGFWCDRTDMKNPDPHNNDSNNLNYSTILKIQRPSMENHSDWQNAAFLV